MVAGKALPMHSSTAGARPLFLGHGDPVYEGMLRDPQSWNDLVVTRPAKQLTNIALLAPTRTSC